jgi:hypothetical protein
MWVSAGLQLLYVTKFYWWETGYYSSYDIIHDYAGFYLCWGCMVRARDQLLECVIIANCSASCHRSTPHTSSGLHIIPSIWVGQLLAA